MSRSPFNVGVERRLRLTQKKLLKQAEREQRRLDRRQKIAVPERVENSDLVEKEHVR